MHDLSVSLGDLRTIPLWSKWTKDLTLYCLNKIKEIMILILQNFRKPIRQTILLIGIKVAEDDIAFKLAILNKSLHLNDNTCFFGIIQSSKLVLGSLLAKYNFFVQFLTKNFASSRMANCGSGLPAEWPFRSQNAIEASDSPLPGGLWVKRLITHALCSLA